MYDRVLELQSTGEAMSEEEYLTLSEQAGNLCAITSIKADTLGENNLADCTGFENNELIGELGGNSFYLSNDNLSPESLSEEDAADLQAMKDSLPELASNLVLYTPIESTAQGVEEGAVITGFSTTDLGRQCRGQLDPVRSQADRAQCLGNLLHPLRQRDARPGNPVPELQGQGRAGGSAW